MARRAGTKVLVPGRGALCSGRCRICHCPCRHSERSEESLVLCRLHPCVRCASRRRVIPSEARNLVHVSTPPDSRAPSPSCSCAARESLLHRKSSKLYHAVPYSAYMRQLSCSAIVVRTYRHGMMQTASSGVRWPSPQGEPALSLGKRILVLSGLPFPMLHHWEKQFEEDSV